MHAAMVGRWGGEVLIGVSLRVPALPDSLPRWATKFQAQGNDRTLGGGWRGEGAERRQVPTNRPNGYNLYRIFS